ncbi:glycerol-3-phosphate dehydrogenase/oxidase [Marivirga sp. S37H4]|uniref:Glycerol-3-phosphate dehydrogenase/oxidase n=1 Tax=Marivirga aurantiaca TaxID=2802615 RepID=A0A934WXJ4_9BACT|nr:glycerol-3-phosphate dehydrogenase/oxidase [Marivirga aurantiaca]MBK6264741.1 glycerol-3-phosphate dehydrogenase/oxidase [Marivirga aurantiaca]
MNRKDNLKKAAEKNVLWDIAVIGGGSSGLGVALDALSRGLKVILLEKADFAKGTSSRSTKLVHGGVRYLAQGNIILVLEALKERGRLLKNAPHLAHDQPFIIPIYTFFDRLKYTIGLKLYDVMAGKLRLGRSKFISKEETIKRLPTLRQDKLKGGVVYHDGQFDDARLALNVAQTCEAMGGVMLNYVKVAHLNKDASGQVNGVHATDQLSKKAFKINAKMVVNATGVFADKILKMDNPEARKMIQPSQGIHLVLDSSFMSKNDALMIPKTSDGRVLFAVPWHDKLVVGTTDTLRKKPKLEPAALEREIDFVLDTAAAYLTKAPTRKDILSVYAGLRPLAAPDDEGEKTKEISRSHKVLISTSKLVTLTGGKWTTFRKMGEDTVAFFSKVTGEPLKESQSATQKIYAYSTEKAKSYLSIYGSDLGEIDKLWKESIEMSERLHPSYPYTKAEVVWAVRNEMAMKVEDVLARRIRILFLDARAAAQMAPVVAEIMAKELEKDQLWIDKQLADFNKLAQRYIIKE